MEAAVPAVPISFPLFPGHRRITFLCLVFGGDPLANETDLEAAWKLFCLLL